MDKKHQSPAPEVIEELNSKREELVNAQAGQEEVIPNTTQEDVVSDSNASPSNEEQGETKPEVVPKETYQELWKSYTQSRQEISELKKQQTVTTETTVEQEVASPISDEEVEKWVEGVADKKLREFYERKEREQEINKEIEQLQVQPDASVYVDKIFRLNDERMKSGKPQLSPMEAYRLLKYDDLQKRMEKQSSAQSAQVVSSTPKQTSRKSTGYSDIVGDKTIPLTDVRSMLLEAQSGEQ